jgi:hypothetical protein
VNTTADAGGQFLLGGDLQVNRLGFGAMRLALGGSVRDPEAGIAVLRRATELGVVDPGHRNSLPGWPPAHATATAPLRRTGTRGLGAPAGRSPWPAAAVWLPSDAAARVSRAFVLSVPAW